MKIAAAALSLVFLLAPRAILAQASSAVTQTSGLVQVDGSQIYYQECGFAQNCVEVCPKQLPLTDAISDVSREVLLQKAKDFLRG